MHSVKKGEITVPSNLCIFTFEENKNINTVLFYHALFKVKYLMSFV